MPDELIQSLNRTPSTETSASMSARMAAELSRTISDNASQTRNEVVGAKKLFSRRPFFLIKNQGWRTLSEKVIFGEGFFNQAAALIALAAATGASTRLRSAFSRVYIVNSTFLFPAVSDLAELGVSQLAALVKLPLKL
jgi:hypothetical protein